MADPTKFTPGFDYSAFEADSPTSPKPGSDLDNDFANIATSISESVDAIKDVRRSDGALNNGIVTADSLASDVLIGLKTPAPWVTNHAYVKPDTVILNDPEIGGVYRCVVSHTSGVFATDLAAGKWELIFAADVTLVGAAKDFAGDPAGVVDSAPLLQAWHDGLPASGGCLFIPPGSYRMSSTVNLSKPVIIFGLSKSGASFTTDQPTGNVLNLQGSNITICNIAMAASVARTQDAFIYGANVNRVVLRDLFMTGYYRGVEIDGGSEITCDGLEMFSGVADSAAADSCAMRFGATDYTGAVTIQRCYVKGIDAAHQTSFGIRLGYVDVLKLKACTVIWSGNCLQIDPTSADQTASLIEAIGCTFDTSVNGVVVAPAAGARVIRCGFVGGWMGGHSGSGLVLDGSAGAVDAVSVADAILLNNTSCGANLTGTLATNCKVTGSFIAGNGIGVRQVGANAEICGNIIGACGAAVANTTGIAQDDTATGKIDGNTFTANDTPFSSAAGGNVELGYNRGLTTFNYGTAVLGASATSVVVDHGLIGTPDAGGVQITQKTTRGTAAELWVDTFTATQFTLRSNAAPGVAVTVAWQARTPATR